MTTYTITQGDWSTTIKAATYHEAAQKAARKLLGMRKVQAVRVTGERCKSGVWQGYTAATTAHGEQLGGLTSVGRNFHVA